MLLILKILNHWFKMKNKKEKEKYVQNVKDDVLGADGVNDGRVYACCECPQLVGQSQTERL